MLSHVMRAILYPKLSVGFSDKIKDVQTWFLRPLHFCQSVGEKGRFPNRAVNIKSHLSSSQSEKERKVERNEGRALRWLPDRSRVSLRRSLCCGNFVPLSVFLYRLYYVVITQMTLSRRSTKSRRLLRNLENTCYEKSFTCSFAKIHIYSQGAYRMKRTNVFY